MPSNNFEQPGDFPLLGDDGRLSLPWSQWFTRVHNMVASLYMSGATADRPAKLLWIGRQFYDTTLGKPVWVNSVNPTVWHDASGAVV